MEKMNVALVHDWLTGQRGGEKVLEVLAEIFPDAPIYTLFHFQGTQSETIEQRQIQTSFLQHLPFLKKKYRSYLPLYSMAIELFDLQDYDLVVSSSHCVAKGIIPRPDALHVCYIHSPVRYAWNQYHAYFSPQRLGFFSKRLIPPVLHKLRLWDESSSHRVDYFIANSQTTAQRVFKYYRRDSNVIFPPVDTDFFQPGEAQEDYFLIVSALVPYKKIDLAIQAFNSIGKKLKIVGQGPELRKLMMLAGDTIEFLGSVGKQQLLEVYQGAQALIMPGEEDFGINALEAQACGVPVVSLDRGGARETVIAGETGVFFPEASAESLLSALDKLENIKFNKNFLRDQALRFSRQSFKERLQSFLEDKWAEFKRQKEL